MIIIIFLPKKYDNHWKQIRRTPISKKNNNNNKANVGCLYLGDNRPSGNLIQILLRHCPFTSQ